MVRLSLWYNPVQIDISERKYPDIPQPMAGKIWQLSAEAMLFRAYFYLSPSLRRACYVNYAGH